MKHRLRPDLPFADDETLLSWATRLAAFHTGDRLVPFLHDLNIDPGDVLASTIYAILRLCDRTGEDPRPVLRNAIRGLGDRHHDVRGNVVPEEFLRGTTTAFCPACLNIDDAAGGHPSRCRRGRFLWALRVVRTCPEHGIPIIERRKTKWDDSFHELAHRVPERADELVRLAEALPRQPVSPLQQYVTDRLNGKAGPEWLDGQGIQQAVRATEMLGSSLEFGPRPNLLELTTQEWDLAGRIGFVYTARNTEGVRQGLQDIHDRHGRALGNGGPQAVYGKFYQWLAFSKNDKDPGPIRAELRRYIFNAMEVPPGKMILGKALEVRRRHSVASLAKTANVNSMTLAKILVARRLIPAEGQERLARHMTFDAAKGERIAAEIKRAVPVAQLPKMLNSVRAQAQQLVAKGILAPMHPDGEAKSHVAKGIDRQAIDAFLEALDLGATPVDSAPDGVCSFAKAAEYLSVPSSTIVQLALEGRLKRTVKLNHVPGYAGILIDVEEARRIVAPITVLLSLGQAFTDLRVKRAAGEQLIIKRGGGALLRTVRRRGRPGEARWVSMADLKQFKMTYATYAHICAERNLTGSIVTNLLAEARVQPVVDPKDLKVRLYRRADLPDPLSG